MRACTSSSKCKDYFCGYYNHHTHQCEWSHRHDAPAACKTGSNLAKCQVHIIYILFCVLIHKYLDWGNISWSGYGPFLVWIRLWFCQGLTDLASYQVEVNLSLSLSLYIYIYTYIHTYTHALMHACMHTHTHTLYIYIYIYIYQLSLFHGIDVRSICGSTWLSSAWFHNFIFTVNHLAQ